jgi:hypothetical protein
MLQKNHKPEYYSYERMNGTRRHEEADEDYSFYIEYELLCTDEELLYGNYLPELRLRLKICIKIIALMHA